MILFSLKKDLKKSSLSDCRLWSPLSTQEKILEKKIPRQSYKPLKFLGLKIHFFRFFWENLFFPELKYINPTKQNLFYPNQQKRFSKNVIREKK
jgi:hypothetical protein